MKKTDILMGLLATVLAILLFFLTSCGTQTAPTAAAIPTIIPTPVPTYDINKANDRLWAGSPVFADGTTSRACFNAPIASYFIYDPSIGTWMAFVCQLADGYGIVYVSPNAPFAIETVSEYDVYLKGKGYTK